MIYFISDTHFGHANIMKYCDRPFSSAEVMDNAIVLGWNCVIKPEDIVFHLGDVGCWYGSMSWLSLLPKLNGDKYLIPGNHDKKLMSQLEKVFTILPPIHTFRHTTEEGKFGFVLSHYPIYSWEGKTHGSIHCYGHTHGPVAALGPQAYDVCVDSNNFRPVSIDDVICAVTKRLLK